MYKATVLIAQGLLGQGKSDRLLSLLPAESQNAIKRYKTERAAQNSLLGNILAYSQIKKLTGKDSGEFILKTDSYGKPFIFGSNIHYNLSHSGIYIALITDDEPAGIDIECICRKLDIHKIARRFFTVSEADYILTGADSTLPARFFDIWTKKESAIKYDGRGLAMPLDSFCVLANTLCAGNRQLHFHKIFENSEAVCHICTGKNKPPETRIIGVEDIEI